MEIYNFVKALPVWEPGKETEMNYHLVFRTVISGNGETVIAISASNMYQMFINGEFVSEGPARAGHNYYRVDEINITDYLKSDENIIAIYVAGYNVDNFYLINQSSFLCAELRRGNDVLTATGINGFEARYFSERVKKVSRFSYQRAFSEYYNIEQSFRNFEKKLDDNFKKVELVCIGKKNFIPRNVPYACYEPVYPSAIISRGKAVFKTTPTNPNRSRYIDLVGGCDGFPLEELDKINTDEIEKGDYYKISGKESVLNTVEINNNEYIVYTFGGNKTGFISFDVEVTEKSEIIAVFDEIDVDGDVSTYRMRECQNSVIWNAEKGKYSLITNEPYVLQYLKIINKSSGKITISSLHIVSFVFDVKPVKIDSGNANIDKIYMAAVETFRQNVLDIYMDCASRERAGWLCDSFFTARVEKELTGKSLVEKNFLSNFLMNDTYKNLEPGIIPMCYPSDVVNGEFIPNYAMWFVLQIEEYFERTNDFEMIKKAENHIRGILQYFEKYENEFGLLENLDGWVFVEWSKSNDFVQNVNYPINMLYARMLCTAGKFYDDGYFEKASKIRKTIIKQSYFDGFFHDHAIRKSDGQLEICQNDISETCQYYAFYTECVNMQEYNELWTCLLKEFGPQRQKTNKWDSIYPSNAFMGNYLRLDLLCKTGHYELLLKEIEEFFIHMAETTGTLWEHQEQSHSCNHGFASHVILWINKCLKFKSGE